MSKVKLLYGCEECGAVYETTEEAKICCSRHPDVIEQLREKVYKTFYLSYKEVAKKLPMTLAYWLCLA